jgi:hypothetical protein
MKMNIKATNEGLNSLFALGMAITYIYHSIQTFNPLDFIMWLTPAVMMGCFSCFYGLRALTYAWGRATIEA